MIHWLSTYPSGKAHTCEADDGNTGWKLHAVEAPANLSAKEVGKIRAFCGLRPKHGWGVDLFIEDHCSRCEQALERQEERNAHS